nr:MAG TPA: hypothetical protein [Caudoviricetes sp.]
MPKESTNLKLKLYNAITDAKEFALDWFNNIFDYTNSNWVKIDDAYKEIKDKFDEYPTKDGTGATGNWNINAESATNDSAGQQIDSTYVKKVESTDDGKLIVTKGNGDTSTADVSTPAGYNLVKTVSFAPSDDKVWLHIGDIKNTADNDVIRFTIKQAVHEIVPSEDNQNVAKVNLIWYKECIISDMIQGTDTDLSSTYRCSSIGYFTTTYAVSGASALSSDLDELKSASFFVVPTSGGNKTSCASVWAYIEYTEPTEPNTTVSITISTEVTDKNLWEYVLTYEASAPESDVVITPFTDEQIITGRDTASVSSAGIVKIGNNINVDGDGTISVPKASATVPGVVKIGTGINVTDDGTVNVESTPAGYVMTKEWSGTAPTSGECWLKIGSINNLGVKDTIEISVAVGAKLYGRIYPYTYNAILSKSVDTPTTYADCSLLSYAIGESLVTAPNYYFAIDLHKNSSTGDAGAEGGETTDIYEEGSGQLGEDGTVSGDGTSSSGTATSSYGDIFVNLSNIVSNETVDFKAFITVKTNNTNNFSYSLEQFNEGMYQISQNAIYDTKLISITQSGASKVNDFTFKAQTSDPGAGSSLATGTILFVYS